ncbi:MAG: TorF family putative porin [Burkholderiaceae bacterium]
MKLSASKTIVVAALALSGAAFAQTAAPAPDYTLSFNVGAVTDYRYRGISQSRLKPAIQGGADFAHSSGFYLGTWATSIKWIKDGGGNADFEIDFYGGYKGTAGPATFDVGVLRYQYPSHDLAVSPNTTELYGAVGFGPATLKYSHATTNLFGFANSKNSYYVDLAATFDLGSGWSLAPHIGYQKVKNNDAFSYTDYALTLGKDFGNGFSASAAIVGTDSDDALYVTPSGKHTGKAGVVVGIKYAF